MSKDEALDKITTIVRFACKDTPLDFGFVNVYYQDDVEKYTIAAWVSVNGGFFVFTYGTEEDDYGTIDYEDYETWINQIIQETSLPEKEEVIV